MSRVKIEDLSVERALGGEESQVRGGGGFRVSVGGGSSRFTFRSSGGGHHNQHHHNQHHHDVYFHDTSHWDYVPAQYVWDYDHYDYIPGHWELHRTGHFHH